MRSLGGCSWRGLMPTVGVIQIDSDEGGQTQSHVGVLEGEWNGNQIDKEGEPVFSLDGLVFFLEPARVAQTAADRQSQKEKTETGND